MTTKKTALIIGASRGLGLGLVEELARRDWSLIATVRKAADRRGPAAIRDTQVELLDINDGAAVDALVTKLDGRALDLLFVNAGIFGPQHQSPTAATDADILALFQTNAVAPLRVARKLLDQVPNDGVVAFMTSIMGSVGGNDDGGMDLYRASKAALNSLVRSLAAQAKTRGVSVLALHPGWVRTDMGGPDAPLGVAESVVGLADQIERSLGTGAHGYLDYQGQVLPW